MAYVTGEGEVHSLQGGLAAWRPREELVLKAVFGDECDFFGCFLCDGLCFRGIDTLDSREKEWRPPGL